jgi:hypothetical protein
MLGLLLFQLQRLLQQVRLANVIEMVSLFLQLLAIVHGSPSRLLKLNELILPKPLACKPVLLSEKSFVQLPVLLLLNWLINLCNLSLSVSPPAFLLVVVWLW